MKYAILLCILIGCGEKKEGALPEKPIGILRDANVVPTSYNEDKKVQIKTDSLFIVVRVRGLKFPQLVIGDTVVAGYDAVEISYIRDKTGEHYSTK